MLFYLLFCSWSKIVALVRGCPGRTVLLTKPSKPSNRLLSLRHVYEVKQSPPLGQRVICQALPAARLVYTALAKFSLHNSVTIHVMCYTKKLTQVAFDLSPWYSEAILDLKMMRPGLPLTPFILQSILSSTLLTAPIHELL